MTFHHVSHGTGRPVIVLHGGGVDHREPEACFEPAFAGLDGFRRIYPDLPGTGLSPADGLASAEDVLAALAEFASDVSDGAPYLVAGHSAGAHFARALAARNPSSVAGLALVCPLLPDVRDVPPHVPVVPSELGDDEFRGYFVVQTAEMLARYSEYVKPAADLVDWPAMERIGSAWDLPLPDPPYDGPTLVVAARLDSIVGWRAPADLVDHYPHATLAVVDDAGHALPHERPDLLRALIREWLDRVVTSAP